MRFFFLPPLLFICSFCLGQYNGAKEGGMGDVMSTNTSVFASAYSPAAAGFTTSSQIGINISNHGTFSDLYTGTLAAIHLSSRGVFSYTIQSLGFRNFRETSCGLGYARKLLDSWSIGLKMNYHRLQIPGYGKKQIVSFDLGTLYQINKQVQLTITVRNPVKHRLEKQFNASRISSIIIGGSFEASEKIYLAFDLNKLLGQELKFHFGINYILHPAIEIRTGVSMKPYTIHGGIGINWKLCQISFSSNWQASIGFSPQISISYEFPTKSTVPSE